MSTTWKGEGAGSDGIPRFGRKAKAWLRRRLKAVLFTLSGDAEFPYRDSVVGCTWTPDGIPYLIEWYVARWPEFVTWEDSDEYRGAGFSNGAWRFDAKAVASRGPQAVRETDIARDARVYSTLDEWLRGDLMGRLWYDGHPGGMSRVSPEDRARRQTKCACGVRFTPLRRNARRCPTCVDRAKVERNQRQRR